MADTRERDVQEKKHRFVSLGVGGFAKGEQLQLSASHGKSHVPNNKTRVINFRFRTQLPVPMFSRNDFSIWSVLKNCIGKELSKITMPVIFNEPLSFLQRMVEYMEYAYLLRKASEQTDPVDRMKVIGEELYRAGESLSGDRIKNSL